MTQSTSPYKHLKCLCVKNSMYSCLLEQRIISSHLVWNNPIFKSTAMALFSHILSSGGSTGHSFAKIKLCSIFLNLHISATCYIYNQYNKHHSHHHHGPMKTLIVTDWCPFTSCSETPGEKVLVQMQMFLLLLICQKKDGRPAFKAETEAGSNCSSPERTVPVFECIMWLHCVFPQELLSQTHHSYSQVVTSTTVWGWWQWGLATTWKEWSH